jgi:hypothetical protein
LSPSTATLSGDVKILPGAALESAAMQDAKTLVRLEI